MQRSNSISPIAGIVANLLVISISLYAVFLLALDENLYYLAVQEDEYVEWTTFWAFTGAALIYLYRALRPAFDWRSGCFIIGLAIFCILVAMEEISWGQRIIGYRPPEYFLDYNFQQELNLHNVIDTDLRMVGFALVTWGYGVALPLLGLIPLVGRELQRVGILAPPTMLLPAFAITGMVQLWYPLDFTGEWAELMLGVSFLFAALSVVAHGQNGQQLPPARPVARYAIAWLIVLGVGIESATATRFQRAGDPQNLAAARLELETLRRDFLTDEMEFRCGPHRRLFTYADRYELWYLRDGEFSRLTAQGLPEQRADFMLDPWNYAYWIRDNCATDDRERMTYIYSFGPNRRRDSTKWEIGGDDLVVFVRGGPAVDQPER